MYLTLFHRVQGQKKGCHFHLVSRSSVGQQSRGGMDKGPWSFAWGKERWDRRSLLGRGDYGT